MTKPLPTNLETIGAAGIVVNAWYISRDGHAVQITEDNIQNYDARGRAPDGDAGDLIFMLPEAHIVVKDHHEATIREPGFFTRGYLFARKHPVRTTAVVAVTGVGGYFAGPPLYRRVLGWIG